MERKVNVNVYADMVFGKSINQLAAEQFNALSEQADLYVRGYKGNDGQLGYTALGDDVVDYPVFVEVYKQAKLVDDVYKRYTLMCALEREEHIVQYSWLSLCGK